MKLDSDGNLRIKSIITSNSINETNRSYTIPLAEWQNAWSRFVAAGTPLVVQHLEADKEDYIVGYLENVDYYPRNYVYSEGQPQPMYVEGILVIQDIEIIKRIISGEFKGVSISFESDVDSVYNDRYVIVKNVDIKEVSIVRKPANPDCYFEFVNNEEENSYGLSSNDVAYNRPFRLRDIIEYKSLKQFGKEVVKQSSNSYSIHSVIFKDNEFSYLNNIINKEDIINFETKTIGYIYCENFLKNTNVTCRILYAYTVSGMYEDYICIDVFPTDDPTKIITILFARVKKGQASKYIEAINNSLNSDLEYVTEIIQTESINIDKIKNRFKAVIKLSAEEIETANNKGMPLKKYKKYIDMLRKDIWDIEDYVFAKKVITENRQSFKNNL